MFRNLRQLVLPTILVLSTVLGSCSALTGTDLPTPFPTEYLPTVIALTVEARQGISSTLESALAGTPSPASPTSDQPTGKMEDQVLIASVTPTVPQPSPTPSPVEAAPLPPTPAPSLVPSIPQAAIQIFTPGPMSRITSPLRLNAYLRLGENRKVQIELSGEEGRLLVRKLASYRSDIRQTYLSEELDFEIPAAAEAARLQISITDEYGRVAYLASVELLLLSMGEDDLNPPGNPLESLVIQEPPPNQLIQGGSVLVSGLASLPGDQPLLVELISTDGKVVGYRQGVVTVDPQGDYTPFSVQVPYQVSEPTWVRLTVKQPSTGRLPGTVYLTSEEVLLSP